MPYAKYADAVAPDPDCPVGYLKTGPGNPAVASSVLCAKAADEVVKVGHGPAIRGGDWHDGLLAGTFARHLNTAPSAWTTGIGFRCIVPR